MRIDVQFDARSLVARTPRMGFTIIDVFQAYIDGGLSARRYEADAETIKRSADAYAKSIYHAKTGYYTRDGGHHFT